MTGPEEPYGGVPSIIKDAHAHNRHNFRAVLDLKGAHRLGILESAKADRTDGFRTS